MPPRVRHHRAAQLRAPGEPRLAGVQIGACLLQGLSVQLPAVAQEHLVALLVADVRLALHARCDVEALGHGGQPEHGGAVVRALLQIVVLGVVDGEAGGQEQDGEYGASGGENWLWLL